MNLNNISYTSSAPANVMLMGEHSVIESYPAIATALNLRIHINWEVINTNAINIKSSLGEVSTTLNNFEVSEKLNFVGKTIKTFLPHLTTGLNIQIDSQFSNTIGLGSSAAVLAATLGGLNHICQTKYSLLELFNIGHKIIVDIQGNGSGTDLAASLYGGVIAFQPKKTNSPAKINPIKYDLLIKYPITLIYSGYKTKTSEVLKTVSQYWKHQTKTQKHLYNLMGETTQTAVNCLNTNKPDFFKMTNHYQGLLDALGVNDATLSYLIYQMRQDTGIKASKISGSGLGDCVLGIGKLNSPEKLNNFQHLNVNISTQGMLVK